MKLTDQQKKYIKRHNKDQTLEEIAEELALQTTDIDNYLKTQTDITRKVKSAKPLFEKQNPKEGRKNNLLIVGVLLALIGISYYNALKGAFVSDDRYVIEFGDQIKNVNLVFKDVQAFVRSFTLWSVYITFGAKPMAFKALNVLSHIMVTIVVFFLVKKLHRRRVAIFSSFLFAVHPILTESVSWISGGTYSQYTLFFLLSFLCYLNSKDSKKSYLASIFFYVLTVETNPITAILSPFFVVYEYCLGSIKNNWKKLMPFFAVSLVWGLTIVAFVPKRVDSLKNDFYQERGVDNPFVQIPVALSTYINLYFWPKDLTIYHSDFKLSQLDFAISLVTSILFFSIFLASLKFNKKVFFWLSLLFISLSPTLTPFRLTWVVAERYIYLGSVGVFTCVALVLDRLARTKKSSAVIYTVFTIVMILLMARTIVRNEDWKDEDTLWTVTRRLSHSPNSYNNLGYVYSKHDQNEEAIQEFLKAIEINPRYADAYNNLGNVYQKMGKLREAEFYYLKADLYNPTIWQPHLNLALVYLDLGELDKAEEQINLAIKLKPGDNNFKAILGVILTQKGKVEEGKKMLEDILKVEPSNEIAKNALNKINDRQLP